MSNYEENLAKKWEYLRKDLKQKQKSFDQNFREQNKSHECDSKVVSWNGEWFCSHMTKSRYIEFKDYIRQEDAIMCSLSSHSNQRTLAEPHHNSLRLLQNNIVRKLTPTECARLQGFPDDWHIGVSDSQAYKQYGNAVTVNVVEEIIKRITLSLKTDGKKVFRKAVVIKLPE